MSQIILDISANTHNNYWPYLKRMLDELKAIDTGKNEIIIKHQLFEKAGKNIPLRHSVFQCARSHAEGLGYKTTASVFDLSSLKFLLNYNVLFVKIANRRDLDWLISEIPRKIPIYLSSDNTKVMPCNDNFYECEICKPITYMACVSKYPATIEDYENTGWNLKSVAISDHTAGLDLYKKYQPAIWEKHFKLSDSTGLDAGPFAITPKELAEIL